MDRTGRDFWEDIASPGLRNAIVPPLAPCGDDIAWLEARAREARSPGAAFRALVLGVTPSILTMAWPSGAGVTAVDFARGILRHRWPAGTTAQAVHGDWRELPLATACLDFACGDGCYTTLGGDAAIARVNEELHRALRPGGTLALRCFALPRHRLSIPQLADDHETGRLRDPGMLRWLFAMSLQHDPDAGVTLGDVWSAWREHFPDVEALRHSPRWSEQTIAGFERWRGRAMRYCFHPLEALRALVAPHFEVAAVDVPRYDFGELFPRLLLHKR